MTLKAVNSLNQSSMNVTIAIEILPENDEAPIVTNNTGLYTWVNSTTVISTNDLQSFDKDTSSDKLVYNILPPSNGWLALKNDPSTSIQNFTQSAIDKQDIVFVHKGTQNSLYTVCTI